MNKVSMNGYVAVYNPFHPRAMQNGYVYEHILVAEAKLGRSLLENEVVHHEDEVRNNNSLENLFVFASKEDHARYHANGIKVQDGDSYISPSIHLLISSCKVCEKSFSYYESMGQGTYCSNVCRGFDSRKSERPSKEELISLLKESSFSAVGRRYGVSDNSIRKWCKSYDLSTKAKDYK